MNTILTNAMCSVFGKVRHIIDEWRVRRFRGLSALVLAWTSVTNLSDQGSNLALHVVYCVGFVFAAFPRWSLPEPLR